MLLITSRKNLGNAVVEAVCWAIRLPDASTRSLRLRDKRLRAGARVCLAAQRDASDRNDNEHLTVQRGKRS